MLLKALGSGACKGMGGDTPHLVDGLQELEGVGIVHLGPAADGALQGADEVVAVGLDGPREALGLRTQIAG
ncbi:MAG: hypothetical protein ACE5GJ_10960 [Gemmatimonadota bacterium]